MSDELFKKMVLALSPKFFEDWQWKEGDVFLHKELGSDFWNEKVIGNHTVSGNTVMYIVGEYEDVLDGEIRPLPSQKQLQNICMNLIQCSPQELLRFFEAWLYEDEIRPVVDFEDFDDLWLKYTVWVWSRQEWDGEKWAEVKKYQHVQA